jgi:D-3-phosphoglycerate dehydrogenase / 2-oxoglutarate reductase
MSDLPLVVGLGPVDPELVNPVLAGHGRFIADPTEHDLRAAAGAIVRADPVVDADLIDRMSRLRVIARTGVGVDKVDLAAATARGIAVVITPGSGTAAVAEGAIAMAMHLVKRFGRLTTLVRDGQWATRTSVPVGDLAGATLGVLGYGRIGQHAATLAAALGMTVHAYDPVNPPPADIRRDTLEELVADSDILTLHLPLLDSTRNLINAELLHHCRPGTILINCGRGGLIDIDAVHTALQSGQLGGVGLDVFDEEPPSHHPIFDHPDVVLTPHLMGLSRQGTAATFAAAAQGVVDILTGRRPAAVANPDWSAQPAVQP